MAKSRVTPAYMRAREEQGRVKKRTWAKMRSSSRWGNVGNPGTTGFSSSRKRTAAKIRSARASFKTTTGKHLIGKAFSGMLGGTGLSPMRSSLAQGLKWMRARAGRTKGRTGAQGLIGGHLSRHRTAKQRATSRLNLRLARSARRRVKKAR